MEKRDKEATKKTEKKLRLKKGVIKRTSDIKIFVHNLSLTLKHRHFRQLHHLTAFSFVFPRVDFDVPGPP